MPNPSSWDWAALASTAIGSADARAMNVACLGRGGRCHPCGAGPVATRFTKGWLTPEFWNSRAPTSGPAAIGVFTTLKRLRRTRRGRSGARPWQRPPVRLTHMGASALAVTPGTRSIAAVGRGCNSRSFVAGTGQADLSQGGAEGSASRDERRWRSGPPNAGPQVLRRASHAGVLKLLQLVVLSGGDHHDEARPFK